MRDSVQVLSGFERAFKVGATAAFTLSLCFFISFSSLACSCMQVEDHEAHLGDIDVVFRGEVLGTGKGWLSRLWTPQEMDRVKTEFRVIKAYKGVPGTKVKVSHVIEGSLCGVTFTKGEEILVFAHRSGKKISTGLCTMMPALIDEAAYMDILETRPAE